MFLREYHCHANLRHPYIVQLLGLYMRPGESLPVLVMECMHASLKACLTEHPDIPLQYKRRVLYDVTLGLRFREKTP